tara:strand:- start:386 stop:736 length:351 start_codon:yes stop_codon:yes gene_type:complete
MNINDFVKNFEKNRDRIEQNIGKVVLAILGILFMGVLYRLDNLIFDYIIIPLLLLSIPIFILYKIFAPTLDRLHIERLKKQGTVKVKKDEIPPDIEELKTVEEPQAPDNEKVDING